MARMPTAWRRSSSWPPSTPRRSRWPRSRARREIPATFLARLLGDLAREDLVATTRGPRGGVRLAVPPEALPLTRLLPSDPPPEAGGPAVRWLAQRLARAHEHALAPVRLAALLEVERERAEASDFAI